MNSKKILSLSILPGISFVGLLGCLSSAQAMQLPAAQTYEAGPFGPIIASGGFDGLFYATSGTGENSILEKNGEVNKSAGAIFKSFDIAIKKDTGPIQFVFDVRMADSIYFGMLPRQSDFTKKANTYSLGPIHDAYLTVPVTSNLSFSAGEIGSLGSYDSSKDWENSVITASPLDHVGTSSGRGIMTSFTIGKMKTKIIYGDGFDDGVWNVIQFRTHYSFTPNNVFYVYGLQTLGKKGPYVRAYGGGTIGYGYSAIAANKNIYGAWENYTVGNFNIIPQVQYVYSKVIHSLGMNKMTSSFGLELETDYQFGNSPWSIGTQENYYTSKGNYGWYLKPNSSGFSVGVSPAWIKGHVFIRGEGGFFHLTNKGTSTGGFGKYGTNTNQVLALLESGFIF